MENIKIPAATDYIIGRYTKIKPSASDNVNFAYSSNRQSQLTDIAHLAKIAKKQIVTIKCEVAKLSGVKTLLTQDQVQLKKQELIIRDGTGSIQLVLWQDYVDSLSNTKPIC